MYLWLVNSFHQCKKTPNELNRVADFAAFPSWNEMFRYNSGIHFSSIHILICFRLIHVSIWRVILFETRLVIEYEYIKPDKRRWRWSIYPIGLVHLKLLPFLAPGLQGLRRASSGKALGTCKIPPVLEPCLLMASTSISSIMLFLLDL